MSDESKDKLAEARIAFPEDTRPYFNAAGIAKSIENCYVAWLDLMGARNAMGRALSRAANYVGKIHVAAIDAAKKHELDVYPVIDGCYFIASKKRNLEAALATAMARLAAVFIHEEDPAMRFLVRGGIAAGRVVHGRNIAICSDTLRQAAHYSDCLAIGTAISQAYLAEQSAPPFGFWVDITARAFREEKAHPFAVTYWRWWEHIEDDANCDKSIRQRVLGNAIKQHYQWLSRNQRSEEYDKDRLAKHMGSAAEYFRWDELEG